jgi:hypothetical protein
MHMMKSPGCKNRLSPAQKISAQGWPLDENASPQSVTTFDDKFVRK